MVKLLTLLAAFPLLALAAPGNLTPRSMILPREAHKVALDEVNRRYIAFDREGRELGHFPIEARSHMSKRAGTCTPMVNDDIKNLPGIEKLREEANKNWGDHKRREVVNDKDLNSPANVCADDAGALVVYDGKPSCKEVKNAAQGTLEGGKITLENNEGISMSSENQVTKSASFGVNTKIGATFKFPLIADVSTEISTTSDFTNTQGETNSVSQDQRTLQRIEQPVDEGQNCSVTLTTKSCSIVGKASLKMIATGMLWFEYEDKQQGHYKWGLVMEAVLPKDDDRASTVDFKTTGTIESSGHFASSGCTKGETKVSA